MIFSSAQRGINLVEVMVTVAITSIGLLGLNSLQLQANRSTQDSGNRSQAIWMIEDITNRIRANNIALASYDTAGAAVNCANRPANICSAFHNGTVRVAAAACNNAQLAASDLWEVACGFGGNVPGSTTTRSSAADFIANPALIVTLNPDNSVNLNLSWDVRTGGLDADGNAVYAAIGNTTETVDASGNNSYTTADNIAVRRATYERDIRP
ncbi:MAG: type IV pilus modification protein PilV [Saccharospirillaceae bacterium]|nr:type IV pilus modification protein PilV [Saccharospirillaceae bacterium]MCD8532274.1 type IV pilus modification protein PilV [Saccharospirillaceae bacterium]